MKKKKRTKSVESQASRKKESTGINNNARKREIAELRQRVKALEDRVDALEDPLIPVEPPTVQG